MADMKQAVSEITRNDVKKSKISLPRVDYIELNDNFYYSVRNELTKQKLQEISRQAKKKALPNIFGIYCNDKEYLEAIDLYVSSTMEGRHRAIFFLREVLPRIKNTGSMIDVGPGNCKFTAIVGHNFHEITLVDTSKIAFEYLTQRSFRKRTSINAINNSILDLPLASYAESFDLAILSHVLYDIPRSKWLDVVTRLFSMLRKDGVLLLVINEGLDRAAMARHFYGCDYNFNMFVRQCSDVLARKISVFRSLESFYAYSLELILHIGGVHLHDVGANANQKDLIDYVQHNCQKAKNFFTINVYQKFIIIQK